MIDAQEDRLIEALTKVDAHGDVARAHAQDPMTAVLRQKAIQADLMRWDDSRGHYVLTGTGRNRISARRRAPGVVVRFKKRGDRLDDPRTGQLIEEREWRHRPPATISDQLALLYSADWRLR